MWTTLWKWTYLNKKHSEVHWLLCFASTVDSDLFLIVNAFCIYKTVTCNSPHSHLTKIGSPLTFLLLSHTCIFHTESIHICHVCFHLILLLPTPSNPLIYILYFCFLSYITTLSVTSTLSCLVQSCTKYIFLLSLPHYYVLKQLAFFHWDPSQIKIKRAGNGGIKIWTNLWNTGTPGPIKT